MKSLVYLLSISVLIVQSCSTTNNQAEITSPSHDEDLMMAAKKDDQISEDSLSIYYDEYLVAQPKGMMLLCHQARWSRGEYIETAPKINELGYSCIALDQISGHEVNDIKNEVASQYNQLKIKYADAIPGIEQAIDLAYEKNNSSPIILVGSSYSASLALLIGNRNDKVKAVVSFSPGEYLDGYSLQDSLEGFHKPLYLTSSKSEFPKTVELIAKIGDPTPLVHFDPQNGKGKHGSKALWENNPNHVEYWDSFKEFLYYLEGGKAH